MTTIETTHGLTEDDAAHHLYAVSPEVTIPHLTFTLLGAFVLVFGMFSAVIKERLYIGEAIVATAFGVIFGPYAANLIHPRTWGDPTFDDITLEFTRVVLALSVFAVGVELPRAYVARHWKSLFIIIVPNMIAGWLITGALVYGLVPGVDFLGALVIAACATPTDPILAASVVGKGKFAQQHVPSHIRHLLQAESGCNDGAAFPFLYLAMFLIFREDHSIGQAIGWWVVLVIMYQILLGVFIGAMTGIVARKVLKFSKRRSLIDRESMVAMYVSLALFTTAVTTLAGSDDLLAAFACGAAFAWDDWFSESIEDSNFSNILDLLVNCATFIYIGATMPFSDFNNPVISIYPWRLVVLGIAVLLVRRLPAILLLYKWVPDIKTFREAVFAGWFGPMGVGAIFIGTLALTRLPTPNFPPETSNDYLAYAIQPVVYFLVLCSIIVHGSSIPFFNLGRRVHSISRTWTQGSNAEPSWLSRVKRAGDTTNAREGRDDSPEMTEKQAEKRRHRPDVDLEAGGDSAIDDPGMDIGDVSARDYSRHPSQQSSSAANSNTDSAQGDSEETRVGGIRQRDSKARNAKKKMSRLLKDDHRQERHDRSDSEGSGEWDEGSDIVIEHNNGEDVEVRHRGSAGSANGSTKRGRRSGSHESNRSAAEASSPATGPGFPGHRMAEIASMIERGAGLTSDSPEDEAADDDDDDDDDDGEDVSPDSAENSRRQSDDLLHQASERVAREETHNEAQIQASEKLSADTGAKAAHQVKGKEKEIDQQAATDQPVSRPTAPTKQNSMLGFMGLGSRPAYLRGQSKLTNEEKAARDAWCRRERRDVDDDAAKAWISGRHLVIERNNGEDVEVVDANPNRETRDKAKADPDLNVRAVDINAVKAAKNDIARKQSAAASSPERSDRTGPSEQFPPRRFDLRNIANRTSFNRFFGQDEQRASGSVSGSKPPPAGVPTIVHEHPEDEDDHHNEVHAQRNRRNLESEYHEAPPNSALLNVKKTGIPLAKTDTTDSQIRWGHLPQPKRRK